MPSITTRFRLTQLFRTDVLRDIHTGKIDMLDIHYVWIWDVDAVNCEGGASLTGRYIDADVGEKC